MASPTLTARTPSPGTGTPIWALRRRSTFSDAAPPPTPAPPVPPKPSRNAEAETKLAQAAKSPDEDKPETKKDIFRRSALKIAHTASVRLPRRRHVRSKSAVPPELPPPSTPTRARAQSLQSQKPLGEGWVRIEKTTGGREGGLAAVGEGVVVGLAEEGGTAIEGRNNSDKPLPAPKGKLRRRQNLNVKFDCPEPPAQWERESLPQTPRPTPTTPYLVADGLKLRTVFPEPPRVHHT